MLDLFYPDIILYGSGYYCYLNYNTFTTKKKRLSAFIPSKLLLAVNSSDGVAARGLVNGRGPYRRYGRDLPGRTFTA